MLPAEYRMRRREDFSCAVRQGRRSGSTHLVAHLWVPPVQSDRTPPTPHPARVGFVVSKAVGNAVTRTSVKRRLRAVTRERLALLPPGALLVLRANPAAAGASVAELGRSVDRSLSRLRPTR